jgi:mannitol/fructose-specific phosphotransferase system IIA component (Ntr-type)
MERLAQYLSPERVFFLENGTKEGAVKELVTAVCKRVPGLNPKPVWKAVWERERMVNSWIAPGIAIPHARLPGIESFVVAVGLSREGVANDAGDSRPVHVFILILGDEKDPDRHIHLLAAIARVLRKQPVIKLILEAETREEVVRVFTSREHALGVSSEEILSSKRILKHAMSIAEEAGAKAILLHADTVGNTAFMEDIWRNEVNDNVFIVTSGRSDYKESGDRENRVITVPFPGLNRQNQIEIALLFALSKGLFTRDDTVVNVSGAPGSGTLDTLSVINIGNEFPLLLPLDGSSPLGDLDPLVLEKVLQIAGELSWEGREGKAVGTTFVLGDYGNVLPYCHQMIINPFKGYQDYEKSILDPSLDETVKEFSLLDGAFIVRGDGIIMSVGTFLRPEKAADGLQSGLGARHAAAAAITLCTRAISVVVSQSTGTISLFSVGKTVLILEKRKGATEPQRFHSTKPVN